MNFHQFKDKYFNNDLTLATNLLLWAGFLASLGLSLFNYFHAMVGNYENRDVIIKVITNNHIRHVHRIFYCQSPYNDGFSCLILFVMACCIIGAAFCLIFGGCYLTDYLSSVKFYTDQHNFYLKINNLNYEEIQECKTLFINLRRGRIPFDRLRKLIKKSDIYIDRE